MTTRTVSVELQAKVGQYSSSMNRAAGDTRAVDMAAKDVTKSSRLSGAAMAAAAVGAGLAAKGMWDSVQAASDLSETISKARVIFGEGAAEVERFGDTAADSIGQSKQVAIDGAATFGVFGKSAGLAGEELADFSIEFVQLASDLASFNNTSPEEAIDAIGSALRGEAEPLRRYGVLLDDASMRQEALKQGLIKTTSEALTPQNKVLAAQSLIYAQTKDAQGDFARTSDGLANSQRILAAQFQDTKAQLGALLLPYAQQAVGAFGDLLAVFTALEPATQKTVVQVVSLAGAAAVAGPRIIDLAKDTWEYARGMDKAKAKTVGLTVAIAALTAGAIAGNNQVGEILGTIEEGFNELETVGGRDALKGLREALDDLRAKDEDLKSFDGFADVFSDLFESSSLAFRGITDTNKAIEDYERQIEEMQARHDLVFELVAKRTGMTTRQVERMAEVAGVDLTDGVGRAADKLGEYYDTNVRAKDSTERATDAQEDMNDELATAEDRVKAYTTALDELNGKNLTAEETFDSFEAAVDDANASLKENGRTLDAGTEKGRANRQALRDIAEAAQDHAQAVMDQTEDQNLANQALQRGRDALVKQAQQYGMTKEEAQKYADKVLSIPKSAKTKAEFDDGKARDEINAFVKYANGQVVVIDAKIRTEGQEFGARRPSEEKEQHTGGKIYAGQDYTVGERGIETLRLDRGGLSGTVTASMRPASGGGGRSVVIQPGAVQVSVTGSTVTGADVQRAVNQGLTEFVRELEAA